MQGQPSCLYKTSLAIVDSLTLGYKVGIHASCQCNELNALHNRHMLERNVGMDLPHKFLREYVNKFESVPIPTTAFWKLINNYTGGKRKMYIRAYETIQTHGFVDNWSVVRMFVKPDRIPLSEILDKDARGIQARRPEFNLLYAHYLHGIEKHIYQLPGSGHTRITNFAKGKNNSQRASHIQQKWNSFDNPICFNIDHSRFDSTVSVEHLKLTHKIYKRFNKSRFFRYLMSKTLNNRGYTRTGISYSIKGTRMSGDYDTGLGNSLINDACLQYVFRNVKHEIYLDGDDSLVMIERRDVSKIDLNDFVKMGFNTKVALCTQPHQIEFCQARFLNTTPPYLARNPFRTAAHLNVSVKNYSKNIWPSYNEARYFCEMVLSRGLPVIPAICKRKLKNIRMYIDEDTKWMMENLVPDNHSYLEPTIEVREQYALAWGINPSEQILIENDNTINDLCVEKLKTRSKFKLQYAAESLSTTWQTWNSLGDHSSSSCWFRC